MGNENTETKKWTIEVSDDSGASEEYEVDEKDATIAHAEELAQEWCDDGDWGEGKAVNRVYIRIIDADGNEVDTDSVDIDVGSDPAPPVCDGNREHDWQSPQEVVGGIESNPGVWSDGGTAITTREVCVQCGAYRITHSRGSQKKPGEADRTIEYEDADEKSEAWVNAT